MDFCEFEASLVYRVSSRTARATQRNPVSKTKTKIKTKTKTKTKTKAKTKTKTKTKTNKQTKKPALVSYAVRFCSNYGPHWVDCCVLPSQHSH